MHVILQGQFKKFSEGVAKHIQLAGDFYSFSKGKKHKMPIISTCQNSTNSCISGKHKI